MKLFSKRNSRLSMINEGRYGSIHDRYARRQKELILFEVRNRLVSEIKFLTSSDDFLEWFILFENQKKGKIFFDKGKIDSFSLSELGYKMSAFFQFEDFAIIEQESKNNISGKEEIFFDDFKLFDLAEIVILFSKHDKRAEVINRFNSIFSEENAEYQIVEHLITRKSGETIKTLVNILKDDKLKEKIRTYFELYDRKDFISAAKISAEVLNIIFSGHIKNDKPKEIEIIIEKLSDKVITIDIKDKEEKKTRFKKHIIDLLLNSKNLSNDIYDVRHTEKSTIQFENENLYKLVANQNLSLTELVLTTLKDDYVLGDNWEMIKEEYIAKYKIDKNTRLVVEKPTPLFDEEDSIAYPDSEINPEDIPF